MLVAPAGYGKTTLARQWLADRPHAWLQASEASSDVVALAAQLAKTLAPLGRGPNERLLARIQTMRDSAKELRSIAELQAREFDQWPEDAWLAIDDYEHIARADAAEAYVRALLDELNMRLLVASRLSPSWATPRALLYGEIIGIDRTDLAMRRAETRSVLRAVPEASASEIFELAEGWPALIGLASLTGVDAQWASDASGPIFDYFADELYHRASKPLQAALPRLAVAPRVTPDLVSFLLGPKKGPRILDEAVEIGFFSGPTADLRFHPLLRRFLMTKLAERPVERDPITDQLIEFFLERRDWDDAFELIHQWERPTSLLRLCEAGYGSMLSSGRTSTLKAWLSLAGKFGLTSPLFDLMRAELALRDGNLPRAHRLAVKVVSEEEGEPYRSRAYNVAGRAAHLEDRDSDALKLFESAAATARTEEERHEATWGSLVSAPAFEREEDVKEALARFLSREPENASDLLRAATARLVVALATGGLAEAVDLAQEGLAGLDHAHDPFIRTSFLNGLSRILSLQARYAEGGALAVRLLREAQQAKLEFVLPYAYIANAAALMGMRNFRAAEDMLDQAEDLAIQLDDRHNVVDARNIRAKLAMSLRDHHRAINLTHDLGDAESVAGTMAAEFLGTRGLAHACSGSFDEATATLVRAEQLSSVPEIRSLLACTRAVIRLTRDGDTTQAYEELEPAFQLSILDPVVIISRALPCVEELLAGRPALPSPIMKEMKLMASDRHPTEALDTRLTKREAQVLKLISLGYTNREIADELVIAEVTAKVHVRNIIRKLGVRSRTEVAIAALRRERN
jgi:LuxR family maltose regulon positive regulatory protein